MDMDLSGGILTATGIAAGILLRLDPFVREAKDVSDSRDDLSSKLARLYDALVGMELTLAERAGHFEMGSVSLAEQKLVSATNNALKRCRRTVKKFDEKLQNFGGERGPGWFQRAALQLRLEIGSQGIARLSQMFDADNANLQVLSSCFRL